MGRCVTQPRGRFTTDQNRRCAGRNGIRRADASRLVADPRGAAYRRSIRSDNLPGGVHRHAASVRTPPWDRCAYHRLGRLAVTLDSRRIKGTFENAENAVQAFSADAKRKCDFRFAPTLQALACLKAGGAKKPLTRDQNCSSSVEPVRAVTEEVPPWMVVVTSSK